MPLIVVSAGLSVLGYKTYNADYQRDLSLAQVGKQHLMMAEKLMKTLPSNPFDASTVTQAQHEFAAASTAFVQVNDNLKSLPGISTSIPAYGPRLQAALDLLPLAIELSRTGANGCNALNLLISKFHNPLNTGQGLTIADFSTLESYFHQIKMTFNMAIDQFNHIPTNDLQVDPSLSTYFVTLQREMPLLQTWLSTIEKLLPVPCTSRHRYSYQLSHRST